MRSRLTTVAVAALLALGAACSDATAPPTGPAAGSDAVAYDASDTLFSSVTVSQAHACGLTRAGRAFCWGANVDGQRGTRVVDGTCANKGTGPACATVPVPVRADVRFTQLVALGSYLGAATCGLTPSGRAYCWGRDDASSPAIMTPSVVPGVPTLRVLGTSSGYANRICGLDVVGAAWCWTAASAIDTVARARAVPGGLRFAEVTDRCGRTDGGDVYCWGGTVDTTVFDRGSVTLDRCVVGGSSTQVYTAPCSASPVRLRSTTPYAALAVGGRDCALDRSGRAYCWGGNVYPYVFGTPTDYRNTYSSGRGPTALAFPTPLTRLYEPAQGTVCGQDAGGAFYCLGFNGGGLFGAGPGSGTFPNAIPAASGLRLTSAAGTLYGMCGVTADGGVYCWGNDDYGQLGSGGTAHELCWGTPASPGPLACAFSPRKVASIAGLR